MTKGESQRVLATGYPAGISQNHGLTINQNGLTREQKVSY
jgi:hypothetical protein